MRYNLADLSNYVHRKSRKTKSPHMRTFLLVEMREIKLKRIKSRQPFVEFLARYCRIRRNEAYQ